MGVTRFILEEIAKKIHNQPCIHYALQGDSSLFELKEAYHKGLQQHEDEDNLFTLLSGRDIVTKTEFFKTILPKEDYSMGWEGLAEILENKTHNYFVFVSDFDDLMFRIDRKHQRADDSIQQSEEEIYELGKRLVNMDNLYLTITATNNPETIAVLNKTNSPYWLHTYFRFVQMKK